MGPSGQTAQALVRYAAGSSRRQRGRPHSAGHRPAGGRCAARILPRPHSACLSSSPRAFPRVRAVQGRPRGATAHSAERQRPARRQINAPGVVIVYQRRQVPAAAAVGAKALQPHGLLLHRAPLPPRSAWLPPFPRWPCHLRWNSARGFQQGQAPSRGSRSPVLGQSTCLYHCLYGKRLTVHTAGQACRHCTPVAAARQPSHLRRYMHHHGIGKTATHCSPNLPLCFPAQARASVAMPMPRHQAARQMRRGTPAQPFALRALSTCLLICGDRVCGRVCCIERR